MNFDLILQNVTRHISLNPDETRFFLSLVEPRTFKRKAFVLRKGEVARHTNFINKGCLREYNIDQDGKIHIDYLAVENYWISDLYSFLTQTPSTQNIDALEDTEVLQITNTNMERLYTEVPKFERMYRILYQNSLIAHHSRMMKTISGTAKERFLQFREKYPGLEQRIPQKQIAAYLGITPEYMSMLKRKIHQG